MNLHPMSQFKQRLLVSSIGIVLLLITIYLSYENYFKPLVVIVLMVMAAVALDEFYRMAKFADLQPSWKIGIGISCLYIAASYLATQSLSWGLVPVTVLFAGLIAAFVPYFIRGERPLANIATTLFGIAYITLPLSCVLPIIYFWFIDPTQDGRCWLFFLICVTKMTDTGAYFFGKLFGKHSFAPYISPKKTWEGAFGGLLMAILTGILFHVITKMMFDPMPFDLSLKDSIWLSFVIGIFAQFGDLAESLLKRDVGVKDSSHLPGLGGMLDIIDSLVFTLPLLYIILKYKYGP